MVTRDQRRGRGRAERRARMAELLAEADHLTALADLTDAVLQLVNVGAGLVDEGIPAAVLEAQDFTPVLRAREDAATPADVHALRDALLARLAALRGR